MQVHKPSNKQATPSVSPKLTTPSVSPSAPSQPAAGSVTGDPRVTGDAPHDFGVAKAMDFGAMPWGAAPTSPVSKPAAAPKPIASWWFSPQPPRYTYQPPFNVVSIFGGGGLIGNNGASFRFW